MTKLYIGIDPSFSDTAIVALNEDGVVYQERHVISKVQDNPIPRLTEYFLKVKEAISFPDNGICCIAIEEPMGMHQGNGAKMGQVFAAVVLAVASAAWYKFEHGAINYAIAVKPTTIKKFVTGKGNAKKDTIIKEIYKRWGFDTDNNNTADAYAIAQWLKAKCEAEDGN